MSGEDTFISLPTGYGKSLCYSLLPFVYDLLWNKAKQSIVLCVSPLTALMLDQRSKYTSRGLSAEVQEDQDVLQNVQVYRPST